MMKEIKYKRIIKIFFLVILFGIIYILNPYKIEYYGYQNKIMAHRVNSLEKLKYTEKVYGGVELDLVYDETNKVFDINHPPAPSIGLNLETYLSYLSNKDIKLWLDFKNLSVDNADESARLLNHLINKSKLKKENVLVESSEIEFLYLFKEKGFETSFYLPYFLYKQEGLILTKTIDSLKQLKEKYVSDGISADVNNYEILNTYFKNDRKFLWDLHSPYSRNQIQHYFDFRKYISDPTVEIILVKVALPIGNR